MLCAVAPVGFFENWRRISHAIIHVLMSIQLSHGSRVAEPYLHPKINAVARNKFQKLTLNWISRASLRAELCDCVKIITVRYAFDYACLPIRFSNCWNWFFIWWPSAVHLRFFQHLLHWGRALCAECEQFYVESGKRVCVQLTIGIGQSRNVNVKCV